jgi:hypothetical protein
MTRLFGLNSSHLPRCSRWATSHCGTFAATAFVWYAALFVVGRDSGAELVP